jgi:hypothetical protein
VHAEPERRFLERRLAELGPREAEGQGEGRREMEARRQMKEGRRG